MDVESNNATQTQDIKPETENGIGKFKNADELLKAYNALESEFTRRSQKLKELEKKVPESNENGETSNSDDSKSAQAQSEPQNGNTDTNADKQTENGSNENEWKLKVDKFFSQNPEAQPFMKQIAAEMLADKSLKSEKSGLEIAFSRFLVKNYKSPSELAGDDAFLSEYVFANDAVKSKIIDDYLSGINRGKPPAAISGSGSTPLTPPSRPKTLQEAGWIFVRDNK